MNLLTISLEFGDKDELAKEYRRQGTERKRQSRYVHRQPGSSIHTKRHFALILNPQSGSEEDSGKKRKSKRSKRKSKETKKDADDQDDGNPGSSKETKGMDSKVGDSKGKGKAKK